MDEEEQFAQLLSQSRAPTAPSWNATAHAADDPWANPFSDTPPAHHSSTHNPFTSFTTTSSTLDPSVPASLAGGFGQSPEAPRIEKSPYVQRLEEDAEQHTALGAPDPPSVIAAREQASYEGFGDHSGSARGTGYIPPFEPVTFSPPTSATTQQQGAAVSPTPKTRGLPSDLIDEDLLAASDPSLSLKKAFVKSTPATGSSQTKTKAPIKESTAKSKAYVFTPSKGKKDKVEPAPEVSKETKETKDDKEGESKESKAVEETADAKDVKETKTSADEEKAKAQETPEPTIPVPASDSNADDTTEHAHDDADTPKKAATNIPLPESSLPTPTATRPVSPSQSSTLTAPHEGRATPDPSPATLAITPSHDRVAVSPLEQPNDESDFSFKSLSIGRASSPAPTPPAKDVSTSDGWSAASNTAAPRFGGKGWGALDEEDDGLFGKGGPSVRTTDAWGSGAGDGGWGEPGVASLSSGPVSVSISSSSSRYTQTDMQTDKSEPSTEGEEEESAAKPSSPVTSPKPGRTPKVLSKPLFRISVGDPTRVGDPVRGYTVYTVRTYTTSPHYRRGEFSVLRRFSDFLWLFETLTANNPGVIVPPVPDKHTFGRFQDTFIETRRNALERCLKKITSHPVLQLDPDLRLFLESDQFAAEARSRRAEHVQEKSGLLASWTGPKFVEQDDWFDSRRSFLDSLESQLRGLSKSIEVASRSRLEMATVMGDFASSVTALQDSDLGSAMSAALARLSDLVHREKEANEETAKAEVVNLLNLSDEYVRFISSVRLAFSSRIKCFERWQAQEKEVQRLRVNRERLRQQGKLGDRVHSSLAEIGEAERKSRDFGAEFEAVGRLVKSEFGRFEKERVEAFAQVLETHLDGLVAREKELIGAWEEYHAVVLKMVQKAQA